MAHQRRTELQREAALRRVAIVLSTLPAPVVSRLLGSIDGESKKRLHHSLKNLHDVDPLEQHRALQAFKGSFDLSAVQTTSASPVRERDDRPRNGHSTIGEPESGRPAALDPSPLTAEPTFSHTQLSFLGDIEDDTLVQLLAGEHPQTVALVLASIAPAQAARVVPHLQADLRQDALSRIARLEEIPDELVEEIAAQLKQRIRQSESDAGKESGQRALNAILAAMPAVTPTSAPHTSAPPDTGSESSLSQPLSAEDQTRRLRLVTQDLLESDSPDDHEGSVANDEFSRSHTESVHEYLIGLRTDDLCEALAQVSTRDAMLALCGLPRAVANAVMSILPRAQVKQVRRGMSSLQSLSLREIDQAKEAVARASRSLEHPATEFQDIAERIAA